MHRRRFVLSWGRKVFFGFLWPLMSLLALVYFYDFFIPRTFLEIVYYVLSYIGHFGLITSIAYFIFFVPVVALFPAYYVSRIWSYIIIMALLVLLLLDMAIFMQFRMHINPLIIQLVLDNGSRFILGANSTGLIAFTLIIFAITVGFWFRGERLWRGMQRKFSNPVSNWYLVLILFCQIFSQLIAHNSSVKVVTIYPIEWSKFAMSLLKKVPYQDEQVMGDMKYPSRDLSCAPKVKANILFLVVNNWSHKDFSREKTPFLFHLSSHGTTFNHHFSGGENSESGLFSLLYSLPPTYLKSANENNLSPAILDELNKLSYKSVIVASHDLNFPFKTEKIIAPFGMAVVDAWKKWSANFLLENPTHPFFSTLVLDNENDLDFHVSSIIQDLYFKRLTQNTVLVVTGASGPTYDKDLVTADEVQVPFFIIWPHKRIEETEKTSSHYDVIPTIVKDLWACKNKLSDMGLGASLFNLPDERNYITGSNKGLAIFDTKKDLIINFQHSSYEVTDLAMNKLSRSKARKDVILDGLKDLSRFYRR